MSSTGRLLIFALVAACGCARVSSPLGDNVGGNGSDEADLAQPPDDSAAPDLADAAPDDMAMPAAMPDLRQPTAPLDMATPRDLAMPRDMVVMPSCHLVINELQTETKQAATEEFVEIYNPCANG